MLRRHFAVVQNLRPRAKFMRSSAAALGIADISGPAAPSVFDIGRHSNSENNNQHIAVPDQIEPLGIVAVPLLAPGIVPALLRALMVGVVRTPPQRDV
jgi:hypothetical protein